MTAEAREAEARRRNSGGARDLCIAVAGFLVVSAETRFNLYAGAAGSTMGQIAAQLCHMLPVARATPAAYWYELRGRGLF